MPNYAPGKRKRARGLLEESNSKYDIGPLRVGPFQFIVNYQHPPIDRRTRIITMCVIVSAMSLGVVMWTASHRWRPKLPPIVDFTAYSFACAIVVEVFVKMALTAWWRLGGYRREKRQLSDLIARQSDEFVPPRVVIRGRPSELLRFSAIRDEFFEPQAFYTSHRMIPMRVENRVMLALLFFVLLVASGVIRGYGIWIALIAGPVFYVIVRGIPNVPTYYRFVPGRMDCLWYSWIGRKRPGSMMVNLRDVKLNIDLASRQHMIYIGAPVEPFGFSRDDLPDPLSFALALARSAVSTATPPPLPMDALTG